MRTWGRWAGPVQMAAAFWVAASACGPAGRVQAPESELGVEPGSESELAPPQTPGMPGAGPGPRLPETPVETPPDEPEPPRCEAGTVADPLSGATKVKTFLTGLGLTEAEVEDLQTAPGALSTHVGDWMDSAEAEPKLLQFFGTALQQSGLTDEMLDQLFNEGEVRFRSSYEEAIRANLQESIPRTALELVRRGESFGRVMDTDRFMMTTAMLVLLAHWDERVLDDAGDATYRGPVDIEEVVFHRDRLILAADSFTPGHPDFMHFYMPNMRDGCGGTVSVTRKPVLRALSAMFGRGQGNFCINQNLSDPALTPEDFEDWRWVRVRPPADGERTDSMLDYRRLREADELVVHTPRVGFLTSPAFFGIWQTNDVNSHRVTLNQALIVALGQSFESQDSIIPAFEDALDDEHADPGTTCYGCHKNLDPMRQFYRQSYSIWYGQQRDEAQRDVRAEFLFAGVQESGEGIRDLARILSDHPALASSWVQKLCYAVNSEPCPRTDPEFVRVTEAFENSGLNFRVLVTELLSSPLITGSACVPEGTGHLTGIARRRHFCSVLENRLQEPDACSINRNVRDLLTAIPDDGFSRSDAEPVVIRDDNLFVRSSQEKICRELAEAQVGYSEAQQARLPLDEPETSVRRLVEGLMGLAPNHPKHDGMKSILAEHVAAATAEAESLGSDPRRARLEGMRSAFMVACQSPAVVGMGL